MFKSSNPMFNNLAKEQATNRVNIASNTATMTGIIVKTIILLLVALVSGFVSIFLPFELIIAALIISGIGSFILVFFAMRIPAAAAPLSLVYAVAQGILYGAITYLLEMEFPGIGIMAITGTGSVILAMAALHSIGAVKATPRLTRIVFGSLLAVMIGSIVMLIMSFVAPTTFASIALNYQLGILISGLLIILGALMLVLDFDRAKSLVENGAPKNTEWQAALGILITSIWIYFNILRFLMYVLANNRR